MKYYIELELENIDKQMIKDNQRLLLNKDTIDVLKRVTNNIGICPGFMEKTEINDVLSSNVRIKTKTSNDGTLYMKIPYYNTKKRYAFEYMTFLGNNSKKIYECEDTFKLVLKNNNGIYVAFYEDACRHLIYEYYDRKASDAVQACMTCITDEWDIDYIFNRIGVVPDIQLEYLAEEIENCSNIIDTINEELEKNKQKVR